MVENFEGPISVTTLSYISAVDVNEKLSVLPAGEYYVSYTIPDGDEVGEISIVNKELTKDYKLSDVWKEVDAKYIGDVDFPNMQWSGELLGFFDNKASLDEDGWSRVVDEVIRAEQAENDKEYNPHSCFYVDNGVFARCYAKSASVNLLINGDGVAVGAYINFNVPH